MTIEKLTRHRAREVTGPSPVSPISSLQRSALSYQPHPAWARTSGGMGDGIILALEGCLQLLPGHFARDSPYNRFKAAFSDASISHFTGVAKPSATPCPWAPRNDGQFCWPKVLAARYKQINSIKTECLSLMISPVKSQGWTEGSGAIWAGSALYQP